MDEVQTWRELLGEIIRNPLEKERLTGELGINPATLDRWVNGETDPRPQNLRRLLSALPQWRELLHELVSEEFEDFTAAPTDDSSKELPSAFYARVFSSLVATPQSLRFWSICNLILQQALGQLDPERLGMAITVVRCMPPADGCIVRSLRESTGLGTPPWPGDLEQKAMFLGAESLAGYVTTSCHFAVVQDVKKDRGLLPTHQVAGEISAAIYPILYGGRTAGCLLVSSTQPNYFLSQSRLTLIQRYADLIALAFEPEEFYDPQDVQLCIMPPHEEQKPHFAHFRMRVATTMIRAASEGRPIDLLKAERIVWRQLEEELIQLSLNTTFWDLAKNSHV